ncbi:hypothetical protein [Microbacterium candidum]|uniref:DUF4129 domain-containing protein n=1 Tax=Microbacterium candidum TaxID=3041922 RepID=A0ABT7MX73_9MICO|nr:hypothetical protein [Microbacterium sp. ASV49]MDL9979034.1 hypothetical protein [Microbacterium sp. ASV49]
MFALLGAIGMTMPFLVVGVGRPWLRQPARGPRSGWWVLAAAVAFVSASMCLTFFILVGTAAPSSRVGKLEAAAPWLGRAAGPGGWALLIATYVSLAGVVFVLAWRRGHWKSLPATVDAASLRRLVLDGYDQNELRALYGDQFPGDIFDSVVALAARSREAGRLIREAGARYTRAWGGLDSTDLDQMIACAKEIARTDNVTFARALLHRLRTFVARLDAAPVPGKVHWGHFDEPTAPPRRAQHPS